MLVIAAPLKLHATDHYEIKPGATVKIPVAEDIKVPMTAVGKFFIRLCYGVKGIISPDSPFPPMFEGKPKEGIVLLNHGPNTVHIPKGGEIGEIYLLAVQQQIEIDVSQLDNDGVLEAASIALSERNLNRTRETSAVVEHKPISRVTQDVEMDNANVSMYDTMKQFNEK